MRKRLYLILSIPEPGPEAGSRTRIRRIVSDAVEFGLGASGYNVGAVSVMPADARTLRRLLAAREREDESCLGCGHPDCKENKA